MKFLFSLSGTFLSETLFSAVSTTIFLLLVVVLYFGLLLIYTFNTLIISGFLYLSMIPISAIHYFKISKSYKNNADDIEHHEDVL